MKPCSCICGLLAILLAGAVSAQTTRNPVPLVVSTAWLDQHLQDPQIVVVHVGQSSRAYKRGHIPGARFLWTQALAYSDADLTLELPSAQQSDSVLRNLGVAEGTHVVLSFDGGNVAPATRVLFTLEYLGLGGRVSLLDGGFDAWKAEGHPVNAEVPRPPGGMYAPRLHPEIVADADWTLRHLQDRNVSIIDARAPQFYAGRGGGMPRPGHIPGAVNIAFSSVVDSTNRIKDLEALRSVFRDAGVKPGSTVVTYCHIGQQASLLYVCAKLLGYDARIYDGSFEDWSSRDELPVVGPSEHPDKK